MHTGKYPLKQTKERNINTRFLLNRLITNEEVMPNIPCRIADVINKQLFQNVEERYKNSSKSLGKIL